MGRRTLILMTQVSLYLFSLLELIWNCIIFVTPKMVKKVSSVVPVFNNIGERSTAHNEPWFVKGPDYIPVVVLKNCEPQLSYIQTDLFNNCLKESCIPDCWNVSSVVPVFNNVGEGLQLKTTTLLVFFLWLVRSLKNL